MAGVRLDRRVLAAAILAWLVVLPADARAFDVARELANYGKTNERAAYDFDRPDRLADSNVDRVTGVVEVGGVVLTDPQRLPLTTCAPRVNACAGDTRVYDWGDRNGLVVPVTWVGRTGAVVSGHLWAALPRSGVAPGRMPGVVIANGGAQAPETIYWTQAALLAKRGYLVLTWDPQGQGSSGTFGADGQPLEGVPSEQYANFRDGLTDALDFLMSDPCAPYVPRGSAAGARQAERVAAGRSAAFNPLHALLDHARCGVAGHSFGAVAASEIAATDRRVDAVVAWDWLAADVCDVYELGEQDFCFGRARRKLTPRAPGLNIAADYGFTGGPFLSDPDPEARGRGFEPYRAAGQDTMSVVIRGGSHYECPYIPNEALGATLRGQDLCGWYTLAWFDRYLHDDPTAQARLLSDRWRHDAPGAAIDGGGDGNLLSFYFRSRADVGLDDGTRFRCDDMRTGCPGMVGDGGAPFDLLAATDTIEQLPPRPRAQPGACGARGARGATSLGLPLHACLRRGRLDFRLRRDLTRATVYVDGRRVLRVSGKRVRRSVRLRRLTRRTTRVTVVGVTRDGAVLKQTRRYRACR